jgi:uncharacterized damage-inducible protein DinB
MSYVAQMKSLSAYNRWADDKIVTAAETLSLDALQTEAADGRSIVETLAHSVRTQLWWLSTWSAVPSQLYEHRTGAGLQQAFEEAHSRIERFATKTEDLEWERVVEFSFPGASALRLPAWQTFLQVMYHSFQHRAQVAEALTRLGHSPGDMDYILWLLG